MSGDVLSTPRGQAEDDPIRIKLDEYFAGIDAVRTGIFDSYFIHGPEPGTGHLITLDNADEMEARFREAFSERYPDLINFGQEVA